ncbi:hypothetical protein V8C44DRAFT_327313 [Trichoderma aethiopicum]
MSRHETTATIFQVPGMCLAMLAPSHIHGVSSRQTSSTAALILAIGQTSRFLLLSAGRALISFGRGARLSHHRALSEPMAFPCQYAVHARRVGVSASSNKGQSRC